MKEDACKRSLVCDAIDVKYPGQADVSGTKQQWLAVGGGFLLGMIRKCSTVRLW